MPTPYPKGSIIVCGSERRKVLEELGDLRFTTDMDDESDWEDIHSPRTVKSLKHGGWKVEGEKWSPKIGEKYYIIILSFQTEARVHSTLWNGDYEDMRLFENNLAFETIEQAQAKCDAINKILKGE